jgi:hypothetical protein
MATRTAKRFDDLDEGDRESGIPKKHRLGASRSEMLWLLLGAVVVLAIVAAFWFESFR